MTSLTYNKQSLLKNLNTTWHMTALWLFMIVVMFHWSEHLAQVYQVYILGWARAKAGGFLGLYFPDLSDSEVLHFAYNSALYCGIVLLQPGFKGQAKQWWNIAILAQGWHFIEHIVLQIQWLTGFYLYGRTIQTSILEIWFRRIELHFMYNLIVFIPLIIGFYFYLQQRASQTDKSATEVIERS